ncbi:MAG: tRNA (adenosine(37)-N6)-threonylcarbamoyltransferase complex ATPase subunit type 1 TsaE [Bacteroidia bacterium]|nr:tRNA (adenosine(37)-N6)-threonylcarbamoyltransferase complex ATPase subunit type 1 TsaE [Bacteroidia bacterium]MDW8133887.1 tRNA (adenosine(37)-N6)-threonylcarbamoyltransferase complex ATPase subunit type 1 TsaE [Bacteroidia bacterium]
MQQQAYTRIFSFEELPQVVKELQSWAPLVRRWLLVGPMGVGKTQLVRAWVGEEVSSPTFTYIHFYDHAVHVDLYRFTWDIPSRWAELYELMETAPLIFIEWADRLPEPPPLPAVELRLEYFPDGRRQLNASYLTI